MAVWPMFREEGQLASEPQPRLGCVETLDAWWAGIQAGRAGRPGIRCSGSSAFEAAGEQGDGTERSDLLNCMAKWMQISSLPGIMLIRTLCFALGASLAPLTAAGVLVQFARAVEWVLLIVSVQRAHQALRVKADRLKLNPSAPRPGRTHRGGSSCSSGGRHSCGGVRRQWTGSRRSRTWTWAK